VLPARLQTGVDIFRDNIEVMRAAGRALASVAAVRAHEAASAAKFELRARGQVVRLALLNRVHLDLAHEFIAQIERIELLRGRIPPEIVDAMKERAFSEFTAGVNRASDAGRRPSSPGTKEDP